MTDLTNPAAVMQTLMEIERDLATRQETFESAARDWFNAKRDREHQKAVAFRRSVESTVSARERDADEQACLVGAHHEAEFEAMRAVVGVLSTRASICQSVLKAQSRVESVPQPQWNSAQ